MKNFILAILLLAIGTVQAKTPQEFFEQGNIQYQEEKYNEAIETYLKVINQGYESVEVYFNLANAYYKTNFTAEAIYFYEKALALDPAKIDVKVNLEYANRSIIDNIKAVPKSTFDKFNDLFLAVFPYDTWAILAVSCSLIAGLIWMLFFFSTQPSVKKLHFTLATITSLSCLIGLVITAQQYKRKQNTTYAIVFANQVEVKNAPRESATENFVLHEGTKVSVIDVIGDWEKIKLTDGQVGWISSQAIKKL